MGNSLSVQKVFTTSGSGFSMFPVKMGVLFCSTLVNRNGAILDLSIFSLGL